MLFWRFYLAQNPKKLHLTPHPPPFQAQTPQFLKCPFAAAESGEEGAQKGISAVRVLCYFELTVKPLRTCSSAFLAWAPRASPGTVRVARRCLPITRSFPQHPVRPVSAPLKSKHQAQPRAAQPANLVRARQPPQTPPRTAAPTPARGGPGPSGQEVAQAPGVVPLAGPARGHQTRRPNRRAMDRLLKGGNRCGGGGKQGAPEASPASMNAYGAIKGGASRRGVC